MPRLLLSIPEATASVTRPVVFSVIKELFNATGIPTDTMISYPGDLAVMQQPGSDISKVTQQAGINTLPYNDRMFIEVEENFELDRILNTAIYRPENYMIFRDDRIETSIKPIYSSTDVNITFKYRGVDKISVMRWRDEIRNRVAMNWQTPMHELSYSYYIPQEFLVILKEIHRMMENVAPYGIGYDDYLLSGLTNNATVLANQNNTQRMWAIQETQLRVMGYFDFDTVPEVGSKEDEGDTWTISFVYKFKYDKPINAAMFYPLMIHNQLIDQNFRPNPLVDKIDPLANRNYLFNLSAGLLSNFEKDRVKLNTWQGVTIPYYDEFYPNQIPTDTVKVFTCLVNIDTTSANPNILLNLNELGDISLHPAVIRFLKSEYSYITKPGLSVVSVSIYRSNYLMDSNAIYVDSDLNVISTNPLDLREYYHIRFSIVSDWSRVSTSALDRIRNNGDTCQVLMNALDTSLISKGLLPVIIGSTSTITTTMATMPDAITASKDPNGVLTTISTTTSTNGTTTTTIVTSPVNTSKTNTPLLIKTGITTITYDGKVSILDTTKTDTTLRVSVHGINYITTTTVISVGSNYIGKSNLFAGINAINNPTISKGNLQSGYSAMFTVQSLGIIAQREIPIN